MERNDVIVAYGMDAAAMAREVLRAARIEELIGRRDARIAFKPNLVTAAPAEQGGTTHPALLEGAIGYLREQGFERISIVEGSWVGERTARAFEACGYAELARRTGVRLIDTQRDSAHEVDCAGMRLQVCDCVREIDFLIGVPVLKGHCQTGVTCALKNMKGLIPNAEKRRFHAMGLMKPIAHLNAGIRQDFVLVDALCGDLNFEEGGNPVRRGQVLGFRDPVLCDAWACREMGYDLDEVPYVGLAAALGVGSADLEAARVTEVNRPEAVARPPKPARRVAALSRCVREREACSACYASLICALERLDGEGVPAPREVCIGQGFRGKAGDVGVGACTAGFAHSVGGCPPRAADVLAFLRGLR